MKLIYQQILAFILVILTVLVTAGMLFGQFSAKAVYKDSYIRLEKYANGLMSDAMLYNPRTKKMVAFDQQSLKQNAKIMQTQAINFTVYKQNNELVYNSQQKIKVSHADWQKLNATKKTVYHANGKTNAVTVYKPYVMKGKLVAVVALTESVSYVQTIKMQMHNNLFAAFWIAIIIGVLLSFLLVQYIILRLHRIQRATHRIAHGEYDVELPVKQHDEIGKLATDINTMAGNLQKNEQANNDRNEFMKRKALEVSLEVNTLLNQNTAIIKKMEQPGVNDMRALIDELKVTGESIAKNVNQN
ncbi:HAMP domain-containing protein [Periweissella cryptocerci]|uniref:histidine kinase n=1 Tax=Periweissella cryptocerci TaxID=2506420 RepID=A0A4P6YTX5_9LACO|nr:HAMP domain-containing protein [Periweissella cryptocerci]QBO36117.1 HAMP domain-containing protein [Periweissella cryptocerci]